MLTVLVVRLRSLPRHEKAFYAPWTEQRLHHSNQHPVTMNPRRGKAFLVAEI